MPLRRDKNTPGGEGERGGGFVQEERIDDDAPCLSSARDAPIIEAKIRLRLARWKRGPAGEWRHGGTVGRDVNSGEMDVGGATAWVGEATITTSS